MNTNLKIYLELSNLKILNIFDKIFPDIFRSSCSSRICSFFKGNKNKANHKISRNY